MFTIKDLARESGYTVATVSRALNDSPLVAEDTRAKILKVAEEHGYIPNALAKNLVKKSASTVCVIVPDIVNPYFPLIVKAVQDTMQTEGYLTIVCNSDWKESNEFSLVRLMCAQRVGGIVMDPSSDDSYRRIQKAGIEIPIVFVGNRTEDNISSVLVDNYAAMFTVVEYLAGLGHRRIALIGGQEETYVNRLRCSGFRDSMRSNGLQVDERLMIQCKYLSNDGYCAMERRIREGDLPTAVVTINDVIAFGVLECLKNHQIRVPEDISVVGFDDVEFSQQLGLTTIHEPRYKMGEDAAKLLLEIMNKPHGRRSAKTGKHILYEPELILRNTCCPPKAPI